MILLDCMQRRKYLLGLFATFLLLVGFFVLGGGQALAMPPGGIRAMLLDITPDPSVNILHYDVVVHRPVDLFTLNGLSMPDFAAGYAGKLDVLNGQTVNPGEQIAVTSLLWFRPSVSTDPIYGIPNANSSVPYMDVYNFIANPKSNAFSGNQEIEKADVEVIAKMNPDLGPLGGKLESPDPFSPGRNGFAHYNWLARADNTGRPDIILSVIYNVPEPVGGIQTRFDTYGALYYDYDDYKELEFLDRYFTVNPKQPRLEVADGDIYIGSDISNRLVPTSHAGQVITSNGDISNTNKCSWIDSLLDKPDCTNALEQIGSYSFSADSTKNEIKARQSLYKSLSKVAQETAEIENGTAENLVATKIKNFLTRSQSDLYAKGEVLIVTNRFDGDPTKGNDITVRGKKMVVFAGGGNPKFEGYVKTNGDDQVAFVLLGNGTMQLFGRSGSSIPESTAQFDGAYISLDVTPDVVTGNYGKGTVLVGSNSESSPVTVNGLLVADTIRVDRVVPVNSDYVLKVNYDGRFLNGSIMGLSPFLRPLVSEASF